jgi:uncharacterized protein YceK
MLRLTIFLAVWVALLSGCKTLQQENGAEPDYAADAETNLKLGNDALDSRTTSATEGLLAVGARTRSTLPLYASIEAGALFYSQHDESQLGVDDYEHTYPTLLAGGGVRLGKMHFEIYSLLALNNGDRDLPARFYVAFGFDLMRK